MSAPSIEELREAAQGALRDRAVALAYLYGSQATGTATPLSDIDIALVTEGELPPRERLRLELALEVELGRLLDGDLDVRVTNDAPLAVQGTVLQTGKLLYARDDSFRIAFEERVRDLHFDFLPVIRFHRDAFFSRRHVPPTLSAL